jgi:chromosome segregation ATPase
MEFYILGECNPEEKNTITVLYSEDFDVNSITLSSETPKHSDEEPIITILSSSGKLETNVDSDREKDHKMEQETDNKMDQNLTNLSEFVCPNYNDTYFEILNQKHLQNKIELFCKRFEQIPKVKKSEILLDSTQDQMYRLLDDQTHQLLDCQTKLENLSQTNMNLQKELFEKNQKIEALEKEMIFNKKQSERLLRDLEKIQNNYKKMEDEINNYRIENIKTLNREIRKGTPVRFVPMLNDLSLGFGKYVSNSSLRGSKDRIQYHQINENLDSLN